MQANTWKFLLFEGIIFVFFGLFAISHPYLVTYSVPVVLGSLLLIGGIIQGVRALTSLKQAGSTILLIASGFSSIAGLLLITYPLGGVITLTLIMSAFLLVDGIMKMLNAVSLNAFRGWGWLLMSGLFSVLLSFLIIAGWPTTATWVIGLYLGVYFLLLGTSIIIISLAIRKEIGLL